MPSGKWLLKAPQVKCDADGKPAVSYSQLITLALQSIDGEEQMMTLSEIYDWIRLRFPYFAEQGRGNGWKNSIRHNLSVNRTFVKTARPAGDVGKGSYWKLNLAAKFDGCAISRRKRNRSRRRESRELALPYVPDTDRSNGEALVMKAEQPVRQLSGGDTQLVHVPDCDLEQLDTSVFPIHESLANPLFGFADLDMYDLSIDDSLFTGMCSDVSWEEALLSPDMNEGISFY